MTAVAHTDQVEQFDARTIVMGGFKIGIVTTIGVVIFALLSRPLEGLVEALVQSVLLILGGVFFTFAPGLMVRARSVDGVGWTAMMGLMSALSFTVLDTAILRPIDLYHWSWDAIGGGSGFWYIPVWWMGSAVLASMGGILVKGASEGGTNAALPKLLMRPVVLGAVLFVALTLSSIFPPTPAVVALAFAGGVALDTLIVLAGK